MVYLAGNVCNPAGCCGSVSTFQATLKASIISTDNGASSKSSRPARDTTGGMKTVKLLTVLFQIALVSFISLCVTSGIYGQRTGPVAVGEVAPDFTLQDQNQNKVTLSEARTKSPVVLVFYRGYW